MSAARGVDDYRVVATVPQPEFVTSFLAGEADSRPEKGNTAESVNPDGVSRVIDCRSLVDEIGPWDRAVGIAIDDPGDYRFAVEADGGPWPIAIEGSQEGRA